MDDKIARSMFELKPLCRPDLQVALEKWHDHLMYEKHASKHTIYNYCLDLKAFFQFYNQHQGLIADLEGLTSISLTTFRSFLASRVGQRVSAISNKRALSALRNFYSYLNKNHGLKNIHLQELTTPKTGKPLPRPMSSHQTQHLQDLSPLYTTQPKWVQARDEALFMLLYGCGLRISEALGLNAGDINNHTLRVLGKRNKERIVPMLAIVYTKIKDYLDKSPTPFEPKTPLFLGIKGDRLNPRVVQKQMEKIRLAMGLPETATPHALRHSYASHLLSGGADLRSIQELMGHDSLTSTQVYTKLEDQELINIYMNAHPRAKSG